MCLFVASIRSIITVISLSVLYTWLEFEYAANATIKEILHHSLPFANRRQKGLITWGQLSINQKERENKTIGVLQIFGEFIFLF